MMLPNGMMEMTPGVQLCSAQFRQMWNFNFARAQVGVIDRDGETTDMIEGFALLEDHGEAQGDDEVDPELLMVNNFGGGGVLIEGDDVWIQVVLAQGTYTASHIGPGDADDTVDVIASLSVVDVSTDKVLRVTVNLVSIDAVGHVRGTLGTATKDFTLTKVNNIVAWQVDGSTRKIQIKTQDQYVLAAGAISDWTDAHTGGPCTPSP